MAAQEGHVEALSVLISAGADFNAADKVSYSNILPITVYTIELFFSYGFYFHKLICV